MVGVIGVMQVTADHYDVTVQPTSIHKARGIMGTAPTGAPHHAPATQPPAASGPPQAPVVQPPTAPPANLAPPRYGERIDPEAQARNTDPSA